MDVLNILYGFLVSLTGFPVGCLLARIAKEELKPGKKYFKIMQKILIALIIADLIVLSFKLLSLESSLIILFSLIFIYALPTMALFKLKHKRFC